MTAPLDLAPDLRCLRAPNPSALTGEGTNTYILGTDLVTIIDPGPALPAHGDAILAALGPHARVEAILVTHAHLDHSPLAQPLAEATGAPVMAYGDAHAGRSALMSNLADQGLLGGGEGVDADFRPDHWLADGETLPLACGSVRALWTPGHFGNHLSFVWGDSVFSGDHVMGWASTLVSPPDGDLAAYMTSLDRLEAEAARVLYPGHGAPVAAPSARIRELRAHRLQRKAEILACLREGPQSVMALVTNIYHAVPPHLHPAAARNVLAHLIDLDSHGVVTAHPQLGPEAIFRLI